MDIPARFKEAVAPKAKTVAERIRKGQKNYPQVEQTTGTYLEFLPEDNKTPVRACAIGYALLGEYNGALAAINVGKYQQDFYEYNVEDTIDVAEDDWESYRHISLFSAIFYMNDEMKLPVEEIADLLDSGEWIDRVDWNKV